MACMGQWGLAEGFPSLKWVPGSEGMAGWAGAWGVQSVTAWTLWWPGHSQAGPPGTAEVWAAAVRFGGLACSAAQ